MLHGNYDNIVAAEPCFVVLSAELFCDFLYFSFINNTSYAACIGASRISPRPLHIFQT